MNRLRLNVIVDALAFGAFLLTASTGWVLHVILPPGSGRLVGRGAGWRAATQPISLLWGMTRQEWGGIHFWTALVFLAVVSTHVVSHRQWIACVIRRQPRAGSGMRWIAGLTALLFLLIFVLGPFLSPVRRVPRSQVGQERPAAVSPGER